MRKHQFKFSEVTAVREVPKAVEVIVSTYKSTEDGPIVHESIPVAVHSFLNDENFSAQHESVLYVMLHIKENDKTLLLVMLVGGLGCVIIINFQANRVTVVENKHNSRNEGIF